MNKLWFVKNKDDRKYPYLECNMGSGTLWVETRAEAASFKLREQALVALRLARRFEKNTVLVRVEW